MRWSVLAVRRGRRRGRVGLGSWCPNSFRLTMNYHRIVPRTGSMGHSSALTMHGPAATTAGIAWIARIPVARHPATEGPSPLVPRKIVSCVMSGLPVMIGREQSSSSIRALLAAAEEPDSGSVADRRDARRILGSRLPLRVSPLDWPSHSSQVIRSRHCSSSCSQRNSTHSYSHFPRRNPFSGRCHRAVDWPNHPPTRHCKRTNSKKT